MIAQMKSNIPIFILISLLTFTLSSCEDGCETKHIKSYHLIDCYEEWSSFKFWYSETYDEFGIRFKIDNKYYSSEAQAFWKSTQAIKDLEKFYELAVKKEDIGYKWEKDCLPGEFPRYAIHPGITDIMITSDCDYDESHPAGTSLNGIFMMNYYSYTQFLGNVDHSNVDPTDRCLGATHKSGDAIEEFELSVISPYDFTMRPKHAPTAWTGKHMITVTLTDENGEVHTATAERDFSDR